MSEGTEFIGLHDESEFHGLMANAIVPSEEHEATVSRWTKYNQADGVFPARLREGEQLVLVRLPQSEGGKPDLAEDGFQLVADDAQWYWIDRSKYHKAKPPTGTTGATTAYGPQGEQVVACASTKGAGLVWRLRLDDETYTTDEGERTKTNWLVMGVRPTTDVRQAMDLIADFQAAWDLDVAAVLNISRYAVVHRRLVSEEEIRPGISRRNYSIEAVVPVPDKASGRQVLQAVREAHLLSEARREAGTRLPEGAPQPEVPEDAAF